MKRIKERVPLGEYRIEEAVFVKKLVFISYYVWRGKYKHIFDKCNKKEFFSFLLFLWD